MRKRLVILTLLFSLLLSACGNPTSLPTETELSDVKATDVLSEATEATEPYVYDPSLDAQNKYTMLRGAASFQETENFFCGGTEYTNYIYFYDKETGASGILCSDPTCTHNSSSCGGYVKNFGQSMFIYNGMRYWITDNFGDGVNHILWKGNFDGTDQVKVKTIDFENVIIPYQPQQYILHQGKLYFLGNAEVVNEMNAGYRETLMVSTLDDSEEFEALFDETYLCSVSTQVRFIGKWAYLLVRAWDSSSSEWTVYRFDLTDGTRETVYESQNGSGYSGFWVTEDEEIYFAVKNVVYKFSNGKTEEVGSFKHCDGSFDIMDGIVLGFYRGEDNLRCVEILDFSGNTVYDGPLFPNGNPGMNGDPCHIGDHGYLVIGGDREKFILNFDKSFDEEYAVLFDLKDNMTANILWHVEGKNTD